MNGLLCFVRESYSMKIETVDISNTLDKIQFYIWYNYMNHIMNNNTPIFIYNIANVSESNRYNSNCISNNIDRCIWGVRGIIINQ